MTRFVKQSAPRYQMTLLQESPDQRLPQDHKVRDFDALMSHPYIQEIFRSWEVSIPSNKPGRPAYKPSDLAKLYIFGYACGVRSSRGVEDACKDRASFQWLSDGATPDHSTLSTFIKNKREDLNRVFKATVLVAKDAGLVDLHLVGIDGTRIESVASRKSVRKKAQLEAALAKAQEAADQASKEWLSNDAKEDSEDNRDKKCTSRKRKCKAQSKADGILAALKIIERRKAEAMNPGDMLEQASTTDPEARPMKSKKGLPIVAYNVQVAAQAKTGVIVGVEVSDHADDSGKLVLMIEEVKATTGELPKTVVADRGYNNACQLAVAKEAGVDVVTPPQFSTIKNLEEVRRILDKALNGEELTAEELGGIPKEQGRIRKDLFEFSEEDDTYKCPRGEIFAYDRTYANEVRGGIAYRRTYRPKEGTCNGCPLAFICTKGLKSDRSVSHDQHEGLRKEARQRFESEEGKADYKQRAHVAETPMAQLQRPQGIRRFLRKGVAGAKLEVSLHATARNSRTIMKHGREFIRNLVGSQLPALESG